MDNSRLSISRYFTKELAAVGLNAFTATTWEERTAQLTSAKGEVIFKQDKVRVPKDWSATATNIVASKYFWGKMDSPLREQGADQMIQRVVETIRDSGIAQGYFNAEKADIFADELAYLLINQMGAFNSPVWFNVGCDKYEPNAKAGSWHWGDWAGKQIMYQQTGYKHPQCSACFINAVDDSMEGIMELATTEAMLFKFGSGTGTNFSTLRSSKEGVSGGGTASGPLSFMKGLDAFAGVIKSGGKTRRAAKMAILNVNHPDIADFIDCKLVEDKKAQALMREGYDGSSGPDSPAYASVFYQNANNSVRVSDAFMKAVDHIDSWDLNAVKDGRVVETVKAHTLMRKIAEATWECGDPGLQFDDTINKWHTCKTTGRINSSNPCSEYMFLDDSACNLASLNLLKFLLLNGTFNVEAFKAAVAVFIIAQDILVDLSGYPTEKIARNSHDYRPLGLGYANLGALLMAMGLPYDSDEGREMAAAITSLMTGHAYAISACMANGLAYLPPAGMLGSQTVQTGAFPGFYQNMESFLDVIAMHAGAAANLLQVSNELYVAANESWNQALSLGAEWGFRNAQVTVLAPTGTIGFLMDCDTTGIEPELSLVKFKKLVGGGHLKIVNETVTQALEKLSYFEPHLTQLINYIDEHGSLEGSTLEEEDLPVFDTAFRPTEGKRSIHYMGHIKMMAATQPFLSGAISKTVNLPNEATVDDIEEAYVQSWKLGLKSVAIYRDGSKTNQPMVTKKENPVSVVSEAVGNVSEPLVVGALAIKPEPVQIFVASPVLLDLTGPPKAVRHKLPDTRPAATHKFSIAGHEGYLTVGLYENGQPGEIFIAMAKEGSTISGFMDSFAIMFSIALQHGVPLDTLVQKLAHTRFEPSGWTNNPEIGFAKSIMDYIARWLEVHYLKPQQGTLFPVTALPVEQRTETQAKVERISQTASLSAVMTMGDAPPCQVCGCITVRSGSCYKCLECGSTSGCS